jgi:hypothetical protein
MSGTFFRRRRFNTTFKYENAQEFLRQNDNYKSNVAADREREERRLREEIEEERRKSRYSTPTFEKMAQDESRRKARKHHDNIHFFLGIATIVGVCAYFSRGH